MASGANEYYIGETAKLEFDIKNYEKELVTIKIYEKGNESNTLHQGSLQKDEEGDIHFVYEWKVTYSGALSRLENETIKYAYKPFIGEVEGAEAEITLKADFYQLVFKYKDPFGGADKILPDGVPVRISYMNSEGELKFHKSYTTKDGTGLIKVLKPHPQAQGVSFEIKFSEVTYINYSEDKIIGERDLARAINSDKTYLANNMLFSLWKEHKLEDSEWKPSTGYDDGKKIITKENEDVTLKLELKWKHIQFTYYDYQADSEAKLPQYPMIKATTNEPFLWIFPDYEVFSVSNLMQNGVIYIPWKDEANEPQLYFELNGDLFVESGVIVTNETIASMRQKSLPERIKHFHLPLKWQSNNWFIKFGTDKDKFESKIGENTSESKPLVFNLSSVVLVDGDGDPERWRADDRFTLFDLEMNYVDGDSSAPYWHKKADLKENFFCSDILHPGGFKAPRVIAVNGKFYDITDLYTVEGDIIGARAAMENDPRVHVKEEKSPLRYTGIGGFELHFFKECIDTSGGSDKECYSVLTYWSCLLEQDSDHPGNIAPFRDPGMDNSKKRWEEKGFSLKKREGGGLELVKPVFFYEARERGPKHMKVEIATAIPDMDDRSYVRGSSFGKFMADTYEPKKWQLDASGNYNFASTPYVLGSYDTFTLAHELGHAALGLDDEYIEPIERPYDDANVWWNPRIPQFDQAYPGMPYAIDEDSMMNSNEHPRMRHYWYLCRWLNETDTIKSGTSNSKYQVDDGGDELFFDDNYNNYIVPYKKEINKENGDNGKFDLYLYKVNKDEEPGGSFIFGLSDIDSILVVRSKMQWFFDDDGANSWEQTGYTDDKQNKNELKLDHIRKFQDAIVRNMNEKFYIETTVTDFEKIYVHFMVSHKFEGWDSGDHFEITVEKNGRGVADYLNKGFRDNDITVGDSSDFIALFRYTLGLSYKSIVSVPGSAAPPPPPSPINSVGAGVLGFLADWVKEALKCPSTPVVKG